MNSFGRAALTLLKNKEGKIAMDYYSPDTTDHRIKTLLEKAQEKDNASKVWTEKLL